MAELFIIHFTSLREKLSVKFIRQYKTAAQQIESGGVLQQMVWDPEMPDHSIIESVCNYMKRLEQMRQPAVVTKLPPYLEKTAWEYIRRKWKWFIYFSLGIVWP